MAEVVATVVLRKSKDGTKYRVWEHETLHGARRRAYALAELHGASVHEAKDNHGRPKFMVDASDFYGQRARTRSRHGNFFGPGPKYDPHRPWVLQEYKGGGGLPKSIEPFPSQEAAARALQKYAMEDSAMPDRDRHVYRIRHATGAWSMRRIFNEHLDRRGYFTLAAIQWRLHLRSRGYAARIRTRTRRR